MSLQARVRTDSLGNITVHVEGDLNFENNPSLKRELFTIRDENPLSTITLDLNSLDFVGSSGIGQFVDILKELNQSKTQIRLANIKSEFLKVFKIYNFNPTELVIDEFENDNTELYGTSPGDRKNTFAN